MINDFFLTGFSSVHSFLLFCVCMCSVCVFDTPRLTTSSSAPSEIIDARMPEQNRAEGICFDLGIERTQIV